MFKIELGSKVKDKVTGFKGIVSGRYEYLYGCCRYSVQPEELTKEGKVADALSFDEDALEILTQAKPHVMKKTGGPQRDPSPRKDPGRR